MTRYDHVVVGAGILGLAVAREMLVRERRSRVIVLEQAHEVGRDQSSRNSGVIHAGLYYRPGSLKARLCVEGARRLYEYCERRGVEAQRVGKIIVATERSELAALDELERRAHANGVPGIRRLDKEEIQEAEPHATGVAALHSPNTGIVDFQTVCKRLAEDIQAAGGEVQLGWRVVASRAGARQIELLGEDGESVRAAHAVFCAGLYSDRLAVSAGASPSPRIIPFRGRYLRLRSGRRHLVRGLIYPVPNPALPFLGVHLTRHVGGDVLVGPSALMVGSRDAAQVGRTRDLLETLSWPGTWRMAARWWRTGLGEIRLAASTRAFASSARRFVPELGADDLAPAFGGIRAQAVSRDGRLVDDFLLAHTARAIHVRNAPSPAATSSLALAAHIVDAAERHSR